MAVPVYARVSTHDQQTLGLQVEATAIYIKGRRWDLVRHVKDVGSSAKERPEFKNSDTHQLVGLNSDTHQPVGRSN